MRIGVLAGGPEFTYHRLSRDMTTLSSIFRAHFSNWSYPIQPSFMVEVWGRFSDETFRTELGRRSLRNGWDASITLRFGKEVVLGRDPERRRSVAPLFLAGTTSLAAFLKGKDAQFPFAPFEDTMQKAMHEYLSLEELFSDADEASGYDEVVRSFIVRRHPDIEMS